MVRFLKILGWTLMVLVLLVVGLAVCSVRLLTPRQLTPITRIVANKMLDAEVGVGSVALDIQGSYPFINLQVDSLSIIKRYDGELRGQWPRWADTLVTIDRVRGGINLTKLVSRQIVLNDVEIVKPKVNVFILNDSINNFSIYKSAGDEPTDSSTTIPDIRIRSFRIIDPQPVRYADATTDTHVTILLEEASLAADPVDLADAPRYNVRFDTDIESPLLSMLGLSDLPIGINGTINWRHNYPYQLGLEDMDFSVSALSGHVDLIVDFTDQMIVKECNITVNPLSISQVLDIVRNSDMRRYVDVVRGLTTDAAIVASMRLTQPYVVGAQTLPHALVDIEVPESRLAWQRVDLRRLAIKLRAELTGDDIDQATIDIDRFVAAGPATTIDISGRLTNLTSDPLFDGNVNANVAIDRLPPIITDQIGGSLSGRIIADARVCARQSMLSREYFHKLMISGNITGRDLYYVTADTLQMYYARNVQARFGTNERITQTSQRSGHSRTLDSLLTATVRIDTVHMLADGIKMDINGFSLGIGAQNRNAASDTTAIIPMGGRLLVDAFSMFTLADSAGMRLRDLKGNVSMRRYRGNTHLPMFTLNADIAHISAGDNHTRFMVSTAHLGARINRLPDSLIIPGRREVKHIADSLHRSHPHLPMDSVYVMAAEIRRRHRRHGHRVHEQRTASDTEVIEWGTSNGLQRLLLDWDMRGSLTAQRARLFTTSFPLRNRVKNLNVTFTNDSIKLRNVEYKAGHSDFTISGNIANMKRALTSRNGRQSLKLHFDMLSDTVDVNELAKAFFVGAAKGKTELHGNLDDDSDLDHHFDIDDGATGPLLIPTNIDAEFVIRANNVLYSDLLLHNLQVTALAYDGAINLHDLQAASDVGDIRVSALYSAPTVRDMKFGFGMLLRDFNIAHFLKLVPAIDSMMPMMRDFGGIITANIAATADVDSTMDLNLPTLNAAIKLSGDSLVVIDEKTFKTISKWLMFKDKNKNMIDSMSVEMTVENSVMQMYPFVFNFDRYRIGVQGYNDLDMNFNYQISVLKSPIPFKFGINIKGNLDDYKIRLGRAHFNERQAIDRVAFADTTRVNLIRQFENVFRRGVRNSKFQNLDMSRRPRAAQIDLNNDTLSAADSLYLKREGLIPQ